MKQRGFLGCLAAFAEESVADSDDGSAFFDGYFEVAAHSHAEFWEWSA